LKRFRIQLGKCEFRLWDMMYTFQQYDQQPAFEPDASCKVRLYAALAKYHELVGSALPEPVARDRLILDNETAMQKNPQPQQSSRFWTIN